MQVNPHISRAYTKPPTVLRLANNVPLYIIHSAHTHIHTHMHTHTHAHTHTCTHTMNTHTVSVPKEFCELEEKEPSLARGVLRARWEGGNGKGSSSIDEAEKRVFLAL